jgi:ABC-2 type transport system permease protein
MFSGIELIWDRQFGFLKETLVAPVSRLSIMIGRTLGGATTALIQGVIVMAVCTIAGFRVQNPALLPVALLFMALIATTFTALGTGIASLLTDFQGFQLVMNLLVMPAFFLSGALFPLGEAPAPIRIIASIDPLSFGVDGLRTALTGVAHFGIATDLGVLAIFTTLFLGVGGYLFSRIQL